MALQAVDASDAGDHHDALCWARRAHRVDPSHPLGLQAMGMVHVALDRCETGIQYLERAYRQVDEGPTTESEAPDYFLAECAYALACGCAQLSRDAAPGQREHYTQQALGWFRIALEHEPDLAEEANRSAAFVHLQKEIQGVIQSRDARGGRGVDGAVTTPSVMRRVRLESSYCARDWRRPGCERRANQLLRARRLEAAHVVELIGGRPGEVRAALDDEYGQVLARLRTGGSSQ